MRRLVFLNRCYWPDAEATGQLLTDLCESLALEFEVHVVCGQPNLPSGDRFVQKGVSTRNGVTIHRLTHTQFAKRIETGRLINLISFARAVSKYLRRTRLEADVFISETDPFLLPLVAAKHCKRVDSRFVCYLQDIYPDVAEAIGSVRPGWLSDRVRNRLRDAYVEADRIVVLGSCMLDRLASKPWCLNTDNVRVIPNWADCQSIQPEQSQENKFRQREGLADKFVVMHSGNMGLTQRLEVLVEATRSKHWPGNALLLLVGDGVARAKLMSMVSGDPEANVRFLPYQPRNELSTSLSAADLHVVSMHERITGCLCPSKLYGILAAGKPVLAVSAKDTELYRTVDEHELGWCCEPGDADKIALAVAQAQQDPEAITSASQNARILACEEFDQTRVLMQFKDMLQCLLGKDHDSHQVDRCGTVLVQEGVS